MKNYAFFKKKLKDVLNSYSNQKSNPVKIFIFFIIIRCILKIITALTDKI